MTPEQEKEIILTLQAIGNYAGCSVFLLFVIAGTLMIVFIEMLRKGVI